MGLLWVRIGVAAAVGLSVYFCSPLLAVAAHVRAGDVANLATPLVLEPMAVGALVLRIAG
ncbi:MAG TPA: hypothetical protein VFR43_13675 [Gaiellaceae bacterium]|nr:hypothetical protein [Gaiellaceae bacterium]